MIDIRRLELQRSRGVDGRNLRNFLVGVVWIGRGRILRRISGVLVDGHGIEGSAVALVKEDLVPFSEDDNVPWIDRSRCAHEDADDCIRCVDSSGALRSKLA